MELKAGALAGVWLAGTAPFVDPRGRFARLFCDRELSAAQGGRSIVQINLSLTRQVGAVRGLHYQRPPHAEAKWIRALRGRVWDLALDLRRGSPTFLKWSAVELSGEAMNAVFIPEGFAHGFQVLESDSELLYLHTDFYAPDYEAGIRWDDPAVAIRWPLAVTEVSTRDGAHPLLEPAFEGLAT